MNIIRDCQTGSGGDLMSRVKTLQNQFDKLSETCYESRELCEEATAAMQVQYTYGNMQWGRPENRGYYLHLPTNWGITMYITSIFIISIRLHLSNTCALSIVITWLNHNIRNPISLHL